MKCGADFPVPLWMICNNLSDPLPSDSFISLVYDQIPEQITAPGLNYFVTSAN